MQKLTILICASVLMFMGWRSDTRAETAIYTVGAVILCALIGVVSEIEKTKTQN